MKRKQIRGTQCDIIAQRGLVAVIAVLTLIGRLRVSAHRTRRLLINNPDSTITTLLSLSQLIRSWSPHINLTPRPLSHPDSRIRDSMQTPTRPRSSRPMPTPIKGDLFGVKPTPEKGMGLDSPIKLISTSHSSTSKEHVVSGNGNGTKDKVIVCVK